MADKLNIENVLVQIRARLLQNGIKLWLAPYYIENIGPVDSEMKNLAENISIEIASIPYEQCLVAINELQANAIGKLQSNKEFQATGIATLTIKIPKRIEGSGVRIFRFSLNELTGVLYTEIAKVLNIPESRIKLISAGTILQRERTLKDQAVTNNQQMLVLIMEKSSDETSAEGQVYDKLKKVKDDAALLLKNSQKMQMEDQDGNSIYLPPEEQNALLMALAIHEKGRAVLKKDQFSEALIFFLEADDLYRSCNSQILESVDNYALLNLDIVWCYLMLKSVNQLPDAEKRISICEQNFKRSYGENFNRVNLLKGNASNEKCLILRLHLLKAILFFHRNDRFEAKRLLSIAENELSKLKVDEESVIALTEMGYMPNVARMALRACGNSIEQAIPYIMERRETRTKARIEGRKQQKVQNSLCPTTNKVWINPRSLLTLHEMGFNKDLCAVALKKSNNDLNDALTLLQENEAALIEELSKEIVPNEDLIAELVSMGFSMEIVQMALRNTTNDKDSAINLLIGLQNNGQYDEIVTKLFGTANIESSPNANSAIPSTSGESSIANPAIPSTSAESSITTATESLIAKATESCSKRIKEEMLVSEAFDRFSEDIDYEDDNYLNISLTFEEELLNEYKQALN